MPSYADGVVHYPDDLPCPQPDTDLVPKERRYISDIGDVKKYRRFQREYQATRTRVKFVFSPDEGQQFCAWYKSEIYDGGAWFYADWPVLSGESPLAHRFVTRPVFTFLAHGYVEVSAQIEVYKRKVGAIQTVLTSQIYPIFSDTELRLNAFRAMDTRAPRIDDATTLTGFSIVAAETVQSVVESPAKDDFALSGFAILSAQQPTIVRKTGTDDSFNISGFSVINAEEVAHVLKYPIDDTMTLGGFYIMEASNA